jgi:hypothetical protein
LNEICTLYDVLKIICCASNVNVSIRLTVCVTVTKNIPVDTHAFHFKEKQKAKGPEVLQSEDISQLVFSGKKTPEKKGEEKELLRNVVIPNCKLSHPIRQHTIYLPQLRSDKKVACFVSELILTLTKASFAGQGGLRGAMIQRAMPAVA